jgi:hypothetical protein
VAEVFGALFGAVVGFAMLFYIVWLSVLLPSNMARQRRRDPMVWVFISIVGSPPLAILLLMALGDAPTKEV